MFSWFLKLLGIDESRPASTGNTYLDTSPASTTAKEPGTKAEPTPTPVAESTPVAAENTAPAESAAVLEPEKAKEAVESEAEIPPAESVATETTAAPAESLIDAYPALKANYAKVLEEAGFTSKELIDKAADKDLLALKGIGKATLKILRS